MSDLSTIPRATSIVPHTLRNPVSPYLPLWCQTAIPPCARGSLQIPTVPQALPRALINIRTAVQTVLAGTTVELECLGLGEPRPHVTWSKVGGRIRPGVLVHAGTLTIEQVERADAGQYRCTATNAVGTVQSHVILHVQGEHGDTEVGMHTASLQGGNTSVHPQPLLKSPGSPR